MNKIVLIVEDDVMLQKALTEKLIHEEFNVLNARDGEEGLKIALEKHPNVIILDIIMPIKDGNTFMDELRTDPWGKTAHIVILTNYDANEKMISNIIKHQPSYYCIKSNTSLDEILSKVKELTNSVVS